MFKFICLLALASVCYGASIGGVDSTTEKKEIVPLLKFETDKKPDGSFRFMYEGGDKSFREESGVLENAGTEDEALEVSGSYRYIDADGREVEVHYTAGRNGFVPVGTNILSEISELAKAAATLPNQNEESEIGNARRARSKSDETQDIIRVEVLEDKKVPKPEEKKKPLEKKPVEKKPVEKKAEEKVVVEKKQEEKKVEEKEVKEVKEVKEETKKDEKETEEKKPEETKAKGSKV